MDDYIERAAAVTACDKQYRECLRKSDFCGDTVAWNICADIKAISAADVAPVVHGRWEWFDEETGTPSTGYAREWGWRCSHCKEELPDDYDDPDDRPAFRFCYNCGAKMDGGDNDAKSV